MRRHRYAEILSAALSGMLFFAIFTATFRLLPPRHAPRLSMESRFRDSARQTLPPLSLRLSTYHVLHVTAAMPLSSLPPARHRAAAAAIRPAAIGPCHADSAHHHSIPDGSLPRY